MSRNYNALFILPVTLGEADVEKTVQSIRDAVTKFSGSVASVQMLGKRTFARPMHKQESGHYVKMRFAMEPAGIDALTARLKLNEGVFRSQILREDEAPAPAAPAAVEPVKEQGNG